MIEINVLIASMSRLYSLVPRPYSQLIFSMLHAMLKSWEEPGEEATDYTRFTVLLSDSKTCDNILKRH